MMLSLTLRRLRRTWRLSLVLFAGLTLASALLSGLPMLAAAIAGDNLALSLKVTTAAQRNLVVHGRSTTEEPPEAIADTLGGLWRETMTVRDAAFDGIPIIYRGNGEEEELLADRTVMHFYSFSNLEERATLLDGRWPEKDPASSKELEVVIGLKAARLTGLAIDDSLISADGRIQAHVVGIVEPVDPGDEVWLDDSEQIPFSMWQRVQWMPDIITYYISLILPPEAMADRISRDLSWRVILNHGQITASAAPSIRDTVANLQASLTGQDLTMETKLVAILDNYQSELSQARVSLLLLVLQSALVIVYMLGMLAGFLVEDSQQELSTMVGRGFSRGQLTGTYALTTGILALIAWPTGILLVQEIFIWWNRWQGGPLLERIPPDSWWLAFAAIFLGWLAVVVSVHQSTRPDLINWQRLEWRSERSQQGRRRLLWDLFFLLLGGLAYWQLTQSGLTARSGSEAASPGVTEAVDPVLLIGPSFLLLGVGLVALRLLPLLLRFTAWASRRGVELIWFLGASRMARQTGALNRVILLIGLTAGLSFFAGTFAPSLDAWQRLMARYSVGADVRLRLPLETPGYAGDLAKLPGATSGTEVIHGQVTFVKGETQQFRVDLLAIDPGSIGETTTFPPGLSPFTMSDIMRVVETGTADALPLVISGDPTMSQLNRGDRVTCLVGRERIAFEVTGIIGDFPLLDGPFALTNLGQFERRLDLSDPVLPLLFGRELWLSTESGEHEHVVASVLERVGSEALLGEAQSKLLAYQTNLIARLSKVAFALNAIILMFLSGIGFVLFQIFGTRRRLEELGVLHAIGASKGQLRWLLLLEGVSGVFFGLIMGAGIGYGLAAIMRPLLAHILAATVGRTTIDSFLTNWPLLGGMLATLVGFYGLALLGVLAWQTRGGRFVRLERINPFRQ